MTKEKLLLSAVRSGRLTINANGEIWRKRGNKRAEVKFLNPDELMVFGAIEGKFVRTTARRLVWQYFFGDIPEGSIVRHKDGNPANNHPTNLVLSDAPSLHMERFWSHINKGEEPDSCWTWNGKRNANGYGLISIPNKGWQLAHRLSFELNNPPLLPGECALHRCDNPPCVNPLHLFRGSQSDNIADCVAKGRNKPPVNPPHGEQMWNSKLSSEQVLEIRRQYETSTKARGAFTRIAERFGVTPQNVRDIILRNIWKHL